MVDQIGLKNMGNFKRFVTLLLTTLMLGSSDGSLAPLQAGSPTVFSQEKDWSPYLVARQSRKARKRATPKGSPTVVQNVRTDDKEDYTRVVLDLQRSVTFTQTRRKNPDRVIIELKNSTLGKSARAKLANKEFPDEVVVSQPHSRAVRVSLDLERLRDYKLLPLMDPPRLVVDIFKDARGANRRGAQAAPGVDGARPGQTVTPRLIGPEIKTIVIDPGHGGKDPGAIGRRGTLEKDITLRIGLYLRNLITKRLGKKVLMTRTRDVFIDLEDRANFANKHDADLFVSIHVNSHPKRRIKGLEIYHFGEASDRRALEVAARENGTPIESTGVGWEYLVADLLSTKKVENSLEFAWTTKEAMVTHLNGPYKIVDHGVKAAPFYVLRFTSMPSILTEIGFVSNSTEERRLRTKAYRRRVAEGIFEGIKAYVNSVQVASR